VRINVEIAGSGKKTNLGLGRKFGIPMSNNCEPISDNKIT